MAKRKFIFLPLLLTLIIFSTVACQLGASTNNDEKKSIVVTYSILGSIVKDLVR